MSAGQAAMRPTFRQFLRYLVALLLAAARLFREDRASTLAAAMSFYAVLAIFPLLLLAVAVLGYVLGSSASAYDAIMSAVQGALPGSGEEIRRQVNKVIAYRTVAGSLALLGLVWSASAAFAVLSSSLRAVWRRPPPSRAWLARLRAVLAVLVAVLFMLLSVAFTSVARAMGEYRAFGVSLREIPFLVPVLGLVVPLVTDLVVFGLIYRSVPNPRLPSRSLLAAAGFAAIAWELAKIGFAWYVTRVAGFHQVYGSLGAIVILMLWIYYSALIVLFGAELARAHASSPPPGAPRPTL